MTSQYQEGINFDNGSRNRSTPGVSRTPILGFIKRMGLAQTDAGANLVCIVFAVIVFAISVFIVMHAQRKVIQSGPAMTVEQQIQYNKIQGH